MVPFLIAHLIAVRLEPGDVFHLTAFDALTLKEAALAKYRLLFAQRDEALRIVQEFPVGVAPLPTQPAELGILAIGVVVALLRAAHLVAREQHRHALGQDQRGKDITLLLRAQPQHLRVVGGSLGAAVPAAVVVLAVLIDFLIGFVVLYVVAHVVSLGVAVVRGDEVDACIGPASAALVHVARSGETIGELADEPALAAPKVAEHVAEIAVPLGPARGEVTD